MKKASFLRIAGWATILAALVGLVVSLFETIAFQALSGNPALTVFAYSLEVCAALGYIGLLVVQRGIVARIGVGIILAIAVASAVWSALLVSLLQRQAITIVSIGEASLLISAVDTVGFMLVGIPTIQRRLLGRWSFAPLAIGAWIPAAYLLRLWLEGYGPGFVQFFYSHGVQGALLENLILGLPQVFFAVALGLGLLDASRTVSPQPTFAAAV